MNQLTTVPPKDVSAQKLTSEQGRDILRRVKLAMSNSVYVQVDPKLMRPMKGQPRVHFNPERIKTLSDSMVAAGQIMLGTIRSIPKDENGCIYELLDGERRWRGVLLADISFYRAMMIEIDDEAAPYVVSVISNFNREAHTTLEVVDSIIKMHERLGLTLIEIAEAIGFSYPHVSNFYGLRKLVPLVRDMLDPNLAPKKKTLPVTAAIEIARLPIEAQLPLATRVMNGQVRLANLRTELVKVARKAGVPITERIVEPAALRRRLQRQSTMLLTNSDNLKKVTTLTGIRQAVRGYSVDMLLQLEKDLATAGSAIVAVHEFLQEIRSEKIKIINKK